MSILWCGGEDIDFQQGGAPSQVSTTASYFRGAYSRCGIAPALSGSATKSMQFVGGAVTSAWLSCQFAQNAYGPNANGRLIGVGQFSSQKSLMIGTGGTGHESQLTLWKFDGTTATQLAQESGSSFVVNSSPRKIDIQIANYGASAVVNVFVAGVLVISFSGDVTVSGMTNFDCAVCGPIWSGGPYQVHYLSEIIVADEDTRSFPGLMTMALTGAGTTDQWTGAYSTINQTTISDASPNYTNTAAQDQQFNITDLPAGVFVIKAVKQIARAAKSASSTPTKIAMGYNDGGSVAIGPAQALTTAFAEYEQLDNINPVTGVAFVQSEMNALQLDVRSST